jgi:hypothetical protein
VPQPKPTIPAPAINAGLTPTTRTVAAFLQWYRRDEFPFGSSRFNLILMKYFIPIFLLPLFLANPLPAGD